MTACPFCGDKACRGNRCHTTAMPMPEEVDDFVRDPPCPTCGSVTRFHTEVRCVSKPCEKPQPRPNKALGDPMTLQEISRQAADEALRDGAGTADITYRIADAVTLAVLKDVEAQLGAAYKNKAVVDDAKVPGFLVAVSVVHALLASLVIPQETQVIEDKELVGAQSATEVASACPLVPAPELPHDDCSVSYGRYTGSHFCSRGTRGCYLTHRTTSPPETT